MTLPFSMASVYADNQDNEPTWRKYQRQQQALYQNSLQNTQIEPVSANRLQRENYQANVTSAVDQMGSNADAGTAGYMAAQKQRAQDAATAAYQKSLKDAQDAANAAAAQYASGQASQYAQSAAAYNAQQPGTATASGQQTPVQYTGQESQIAQMARNAGFSEDVIPTVVAISQAESSGRADATHRNSDKYGSTDLGLMQINDHWHPDLLAKGDWKDPQQNMNMAYQIYKSAGNSFTPWSTFKGGDYEKFLSGAQAAAKQSYIQPANVPAWSVNTNVGMRTAIVEDAKRYIGLPYVWGGTDLSKGVDCSGLVQSVYKQMGISMPRTADEDSHMGTRTSIANLQPGDLVCWQGGWRGPNYVGHVAIYAGNGQIIEAPHTGADVRVRSLRTDEHPFGVHLTIGDPKNGWHMPTDNFPSGTGISTQNLPKATHPVDDGWRDPGFVPQSKIPAKSTSSGSATRTYSSGSARRG